MQNFFFSRICSGRQMSTNGKEDEIKNLYLSFFLRFRNKAKPEGSYIYAAPSWLKNFKNLDSSHIQGRPSSAHTRTYTHTTLMRYHCWVNPLALVGFGFILTLHQLCSCCRKHFRLTHYEVSLHQSKLQRNGFICSSSFI